MNNKFDVIAPGETCKAAPHADRAAVLIDAANYYSALRSSMLKAERSIYIVGWDIDSRVLLRGDKPSDDGAPERLRDFLSYLSKRKPALKVHVLLWDFSILYALEREPIPALNLDWATPREIEVCLDDIVPLGASHHQKIVTIDDRVAYCGGLDLAVRRWDTRAHQANNPKRVDPLGKSYKPFHDIQCVVDGEAARTLCDLVTARWESAACKTPYREVGPVDPWPDGVEPDFTGIRPGIARTVAPLNRRPGIYEVEAMYLRMVEKAERVIYLENQFITATVVAEAMVKALRNKPDLEIILVTSRDPHGFLEAYSMATGRERFMTHFEEAGVMDRVRLVHPRVPNGEDEGQDVLVHAKVMAVDDKVFRVGSSNLNNRSMGTDGECDLIFEATNDAERATVKGLRDELLGEHLGIPVADVQAKIDAYRSVRALIDARQDEPRTLCVTDYKVEVNENVSSALGPVADPERPSDASQFLGDMMSARPAGTRVRGRWLFAGSIALVAILIAVWQISPLAQFTDPEKLERVLTGLRNDPWAYVIVPLAFVLGSAVVFPITAMIAATAFVFPPLSAFIIAFAGSLLGAGCNYALGMALGNTALRPLMGKRLNRISRALARKGVLTVVTLRIVPIAPFTLINLVAGASHIRFVDFAVGTVIGLLPGILAMTLVGNRLFELLKDPTLVDMLLAAGAVAAWFGVSVGAQRLIRRYERKRARRI